MNTSPVNYPELDAAIRGGARLTCRVGIRSGRVGASFPAAPRRFAELSNDQGEGLVTAGGICLPHALHRADIELLRADETSEACSCAICAQPSRTSDNGGAPEAVSALDAHLLSNRHFEVDWCDGRFRLAASWKRDAFFDLPLEIQRQIRQAGVPSRWRHEEFVFEFTPFINKRTGNGYLKGQMISHPPGQAVLRQDRRVEVTGDSLAAVLAAAEEPMATSRREDEQWLSLTRPV